MGLFIKGMNMPEYRDIYSDGRAAVYLCMLSVNKDGSAFLYCNGSNKEYCTVSEITTPHGRLIDADNIKLDNICDYCEQQYCKNGYECFIDNVESTLRSEIAAPTVIDAEVDYD